MRRRSSTIAVGLVLFVLGFLVVLQFNLQSAQNGLNALSVQELGELVANQTTRNNQLREEISTLQRQKESVSAIVQRGDSSSGQVRTDLNRILAWSGALAVNGAGVRVTVEGPVSGEALSILLNELRNAGAEAISIGDIRVVAGLVPDGPAGSVMAAGVPLADPVELRAIGQPEALSGSLTRAGGPIAQLAARYPDVIVTVYSMDLLDIPATDHDLGPKLGKPRL